jgi:hypothetical protein
LLNVRRKRVKGAGPNWVGMLGPKAENNWADVENQREKERPAKTIWAENKIKNKWAT